MRFPNPSHDKYRLEFRIADGWNTMNMEEKINSLLKDGWRLHGGMHCVFGGSSGIHFYQAVTKLVSVDED